MISNAGNQFYGRWPNPAGGATLKGLSLSEMQNLMNSDPERVAACQSGFSPHGVKLIDSVCKFQEHAVNDDPLFVDPTIGVYDLRLQNNSHIHTHHEAPDCTSQLGALRLVCGTHRRRKKREQIPDAAGVHPRRRRGHRGLPGAGGGVHPARTVNGRGSSATVVRRRCRVCQGPAPRVSRARPIRRCL